MEIILRLLVFVGAVYCRIQLLAMNTLPRMSLLQRHLFEQLELDYILVNELTA
jgi:hypothetical protein